MRSSHSALQRVATTVALVAFAAAAHAQAPTASAAQPLGIGETFTIESAALGETRRINVYLPAGYASASDARVPVLYMPDGGIDEDFLHVAGLLQISALNGTMRPFILVGIENTQRRRDMTGPTQVASDSAIAPRVGGSAAFRTFIRSELIPVIDARYRTTAERAIVGESLAGLFVVETFLLEPDLFNTYIAIDPSLWWNGARLVETGAELLRTQDRSGRTIYVASSGQPELSQLASRFADMVRASTGRGLQFHYRQLPEETHGTIYHPAALGAFRALFKPEPR